MYVLLADLRKDGSLRRFCLSATFLTYLKAYVVSIPGSLLLVDQIGIHGGYTRLDTNAANAATKSFPCSNSFFYRKDILAV